MTTYTDRYAHNARRVYPDKISQGVISMAQKLEAGVATPSGKKTVTLRLLVEMAVHLDVECGIFLNASGALCLSRGRVDAISIPNGCTIIAHSHPTTSDIINQIAGDMRRCSDQVEMVVTAAGLVIYYSEGRCYNKRSGDHIQSKVLQTDGHRPGAYGLDDPITTDTPARLGSFV